MRARGLASVLGATSVACAVACSAPRAISHIEDKARLDVPIAICRTPLGPGELGDAGAPNAENAAPYWRALVPASRSAGTTLSPGDVDCTGAGLAEGAHGSVTSVPIGPADTVVVPADDGSAVVWLTPFRQADGARLGPIAYVRARPSELDVYAVGTFRAKAAHARFVAARLGDMPVVVAYDDPCSESKVDTECDSTLHVYGVVGGKMEDLAQSPAQSVRFGNLKGIGRVQYRLVTSPPVFDKQVMRVHETLQVRNAADEEIRKAEGDRVFTLSADGRCVPAQESLLAQVPAP